MHHDTGVYRRRCALAVTSGIDGADGDCIDWDNFSEGADS